MFIGGIDIQSLKPSSIQYKYMPFYRLQHFRNALDFNIYFIEEKKRLYGY